jgi:epoxyqueuosine reductase QueG
VSSERENKEHLIKYARDLGADLCGVADVTEIRHEFNLGPALRDTFDRALSLGKRIIGAVLEGIEDGPTPLYLHHYRQLNFFLDRAALLVSSFIQDKGFRALPIPASQIIDWEKQLAHLSHKKVALHAGLGWLGRNNLVVHPEFGSQFRLVTVLTDMPLEPDKPLARDCGSCVRCLSSCPAGAIKKGQGDFDHLACFEKLKEFKRSGVVSQHICGVCVKACRKPPRSAWPRSR